MRGAWRTPRGGCLEGGRDDVPSLETRIVAKGYIGGEVGVKGELKGRKERLEETYTERRVQGVGGSWNNDGAPAISVLSEVGVRKLHESFFS